MKSLKRRLLSLFLAMVMVLSLAPGALAEDSPVEGSGNDTHTITYTQSGSNGSFTHTATCSVQNCDQGHVIPSATSCTPGTEWKSNGSKHWLECSVCKQSGHLNEADHSLKYVQATNGNKHTQKCDNCNFETQATDCTYTEDNRTKCKCGRVKPADALKSITLSSTSLELDVGSSNKLTATANPEGASLSGITWKSSAPTVATVDNDGKVTAVKAGTATITAKVGTTEATCTVTVKAGYSINVSSSVSVKQGSTKTIDPTLYQGTAKIENATFSYDSDNKSVATVNEDGVIRGVAPGTAKITVSCIPAGSSTPVTATVSVTVASLFEITCSSKTFTSMGQSITLTPKYDGKEVTGDRVRWSIDSGEGYFDTESGDNYRLIVTPSSSGTSRSCTITASVTIEDVPYTDKVTLTSNIDTDLDLTATVSSEYVFSDLSDKGSYSVEEQLFDQLEDINRDLELDYVEFDNVSTTYGKLEDIRTSTKVYADEFGDIQFTPTKKGDAVFRFTAYAAIGKSANRKYDGVLTITVTDASDSSGDVVFYGDVGEDVSLDSGSFEDFWDDEYPNGELEYVTFSVSGGTLRDADGKTVGSKKCYVRAGRNEIELDEVYFEPNSTNKKTAKTVSFSFTAYGENKSGTNKEASGRVSIVYTAENPDDITYTSGSNGTVSLKASDFTAAYKEVISGSVPSNLTIVFQSVPRNGTLTYNDSSKKNAKDVKLTSNNIKKYSFTTKSSGSNQLNDVVYSGTSGTDTIDYIAYSGSTIKFKGSVVFNGKGAVPQDVVVYYASTAGQPARFSQNDFVTANSAMSKAAKIRFVTPANGTLYLNGSTTAAGIDIAPALLYSVTYQPKAGFNGTDKVVFAAYDASNNLVANGSVNITVAGNPTTSTTPGGTTNPGGVTDVSQFTDVSGNAWYRANLATLVSKGVISGRGDGKFDPKGTVTYGEALKMVLESCGYTAAVGTGSQWAINYKNLAVSKGWISNNIDLNAAISRNATAELAAKVLGVAPVTSGSPFGDEANAYAVALYYTTPQIFVGTTNPNGGKPLFENSKPLLREQVCAVICRVSDYHTQHTTNVMPDGV